MLSATVLHINFDYYTEVLPCTAVPLSWIIINNNLFLFFVWQFKFAKKVKMANKKKFFFFKFLTELRDLLFSFNRETI